jgi:hypothetical protein
MSANIRRPLAASLFGSALVLVGLISFTTPAAGQVSGAVVIYSGPVRGRVAIGEPAFVPRYAPQVVFVERGHEHHGRSDRWYRRHGYRAATLFYSDGRYFTQMYAGRGYRRGPRFIPVLAWERGGRFYLSVEGGFPEYGYRSSYDRNSSHGHEYESDRPHGDSRDRDE